MKKKPKKVMTQEQLDELEAVKNALIDHRSEVVEIKADLREQKLAIRKVQADLRVAEKVLRATQSQLGKLTIKYRGWKKPKAAGADSAIEDALAGTTMQ